MVEDVYRRRLKKRDEAMLDRIANIKRFVECLVGDRPFRNRLIQEPQKAREIVRGKGIDIDPYAMLPVWEKGLRIDFANIDKERRFPLIELWTDWLKDRKKIGALFRELGEDQCPDRRFIRWRKRQMARSDSELGDSGKANYHLAVAFELSKGCTRGCWFCGLSAESFKGFFPHSEANARLWRGILSAFREVFGGLLQTGFCYWATEPTDNPDYLRFVTDFYEVAGVVPQTTSAAPLKDLAWTRELLKLHATHKSIPCRFSVLDVRTLHKLHEAFTPRELLNIPLILHIKGSIVAKTRVGRMRCVEEKGKSGEVRKDLGTIACVSGFLVNMVEKSIQLISPCPASEKWPLGYRIYAMETFQDAHDFHDKILKITEECMGDTPENDRPVSFRKDLEFERIPEGFLLKNRFMRYTFKGQRLWKTVGNVIDAGRFSRATLIDKLGEQGVDVLTAISALETLVEKGLIDDEPAANFL